MNCQTVASTSSAYMKMQLNTHEEGDFDIINENTNLIALNNSRTKPQPFKTTQDIAKGETEGNKQSPHFLLKKLQPGKASDCNLELLITAADTLLDQGLDISKLNDSINYKNQEFTQRKCDNKICPVQINKASHLYQAKIKQKEQYFCIQCYQAWKKGQFCYYCGIIYREYKGTKGFNQHKSWVGCDYCKNWEHIQCEETKGEYPNLSQLIKNHKFKYKCPICRKEGQNTNANTSIKTEEKNKTYSQSYISNESNQGLPNLFTLTKEEFDKEYEKSKYFFNELVSKPLKLRSIKALMNNSDIKEFLNDIETITSVIK